MKCYCDLLSGLVNPLSNLRVFIDGETCSKEDGDREDDAYCRNIFSISSVKSRYLALESNMAHKFVAHL